MGNGVVVGARMDLVELLGVVVGLEFWEVRYVGGIFRFLDDLCAAVSLQIAIRVCKNFPSNLVFDYPSRVLCLSLNCSLIISVLIAFFMCRLDRR